MLCYLTRADLRPAGPLASFLLPQFPFVRRRKGTRLRQGIIRIADHKSLHDKERSLDRDEGGNHHHKEKKQISRLVNSPPEGRPGFVISSPSARARPGGG
jgi:hypothetical protein